MSNGKTERDIKKVRNEILVVLQMIYPAPLQADQLLRSLLAVFPLLEWDHLRRDLAYLLEKGYVNRVVPDTETDAQLTPWRKRWFRLTSTGVEVADHCIQDPALEE